MSNERIKVNSNARTLSESRIKASKLCMVRFEEIFDCLSEEPLSIGVIESKGSNEHLYSRDIRIRLWNHNGKSLAWNIYLNESPRIESLVIRKVIWNQKKDKEFAMNNLKDNREFVLSINPSIEIYNIFVPDDKSRDIIRAINKLDNEIEKGITLNNNEHPSYQFRDMEILRHYDWGQIHMLWSPCKENKIVEENIGRLIDCLDSMIECQNKIYSMILKYESQL